MAKKKIENTETIDEALLGDDILVIEVDEVVRERVVNEVQAGKYNVKRTQEGSLS